MDQRVKVGAAMLVGALILGILGDSLLRVGPWSLNFFVFMAACVGILLALVRRCKIPWSGEGRWLLFPILGLAAFLAIRDSMVLKTVNIAAILFCLALVLLRARGGSVRSFGVGETLVGLATAGLNTGFGFVLLLFGDIPWASIPRDGAFRHLGAVGRGLLIAIPLLLVFGGLFAAADASFERIIHRLFNFNPEEILQHMILISLWMWVAGGFLRGTLLRENSKLLTLPRPKLLTLGSVETGISLGLLNLLFCAFVCVQLPYLFGGQAHVLATSGLTASAYARRGFFELVTVAALVLPLLLLVRGLLEPDTAAGNPPAAGAGRALQVFTPLACSLCGLTLAVMVSAVQRMVLYFIGFGLTEQRYYATAFMGWMVFVLIWFVVTSLRNRREQFVFGAMLSCLSVLFGLNLANPDHFIVQANLGRLARGRSFDAAYASALSADAFPAVFDAWPRLSAAHRREIALSYRASECSRRGKDWRIWNFGRALARTRAAAHTSEIDSIVNAEQATAPR